MGGNSGFFDDLEGVNDDFGSPSEVWAADLGWEINREAKIAAAFDSTTWETEINNLRDGLTHENTLKIFTAKVSFLEKKEK